MLVLSILIILALGTAVASFFLAGTLWLLLVSAALVVSAFYVSRRAARNNAAADAQDFAPAHPVRAHLTVTVSDQLPESGRHRDGEVIEGPLRAVEPFPESGRAVAS